VSIIYIHGTASVFTLLNYFLQEVALRTLLINLITFFTSLKKNFFPPLPLPTKYAIPEMQLEVCKVCTFQDIYTYYTFKGLHYIVTVTQFRAYIFYVNVPVHIFSQM
jgi:hypothetical protein